MKKISLCEIEMALTRRYIRICNELRALRKYKNNMSLMHKCVEIGDFSYVIPILYIWNTKTKLKIGRFCSIGDNVTILLGGEHRTDWISTYPFNTMIKSFSNMQVHPATKGDIIIGNDVWVAQGVRILSGVTIGDGAVIGADALVTSDIPPYSVCGGMPAKVIKYRFDEEIRSKLLEIKWWDWSDAQIYGAVKYLQSNDFNGLFEYYEKEVKQAK